MTRSLGSAIDNAITVGTGYSLVERLKVDKTWIFYSAFTSSCPAQGADDVGISDSPVAQDIVFGNTKLITFYNTSGSLQYQVEGSATLVTATYGGSPVLITGKPGVFANSLFLVSSGNLRKYTIDFSLAESLTPACLTATEVIEAMPLYTVAHGVASNACVCFWGSDGGVKASLFIKNGSWVRYDQPKRFMFPLSYDYTSGSAARSLYSFSLFSSAAMLGGDVYAYISNALTGGVEGIKWDSNSKVWSDIYPAVASDLTSSICEFRIANSYVSGGTVYLSGQFKRNENVDSPIVYSMILRSTDGKIFTLDRFGLVSDLNYRLLAGLWGGQLYVANCNRVAKTEATWLFGGSMASLYIPAARLGSIRDSDLSTLEVEFGDGGEEYMYNPSLVIGSKITLQIGYETTSGSQIADYGTYYIDTLKKGVQDGARLLSMSAVNMSMWQLQGMSSPFYTEVISKSSVRDDLDSFDTTQMYPAEGAGINEDEFSVDFWESEPYEDLIQGIYGIDIHEKGGIDRTHLSVGHKNGIKTRDLLDELGARDYPEFTSGSAVFKVYGWSYPDEGNFNDGIKLVLWLEAPDGTLETYSTDYGWWPCTYPGTDSGDYPIVYLVEKPIGTKIRQLGLVFENYDPTNIYPCRVDCTSGTNTYFTAPDTNTGWYSSEDKEWKIRGKARACIMFSRSPYDTFNFQIDAEFEENVQGYTASYGPVAYGLVGLAEDARNYIAARYNKVTSKLEIVKARLGVETTLANVTPTVGVSGGCQMMFIHRDGSFEIKLRNSQGIWVSQLTYDWTLANSWMFTSGSAAKHTGVYGFINVPFFRISGFDEGTTENLDKAIGIPMLPGDNALSSFPTSGYADIGDQVYAYNGVINPAVIRGPFQYRQHGHYQPPYGNGYGLECRDHDWNGTDGSYTGYLMGVDDGTVYKITGSKWRTFNKTGGVTQWLPGRARFYAQQDILTDAFHTLSNKVYITGGLDNASLLRGEATSQPWGETCMLHTDGTVKLIRFAGSSGDVDATVEDLVERISANSGASVQFPGDYTAGSLAMTQDTYHQITSIPYTDGFDVRFEVAALTGTSYVGVDANVVAAEDYPDDTNLQLRLSRVSSGSYTLALVSRTSGSYIDRVGLALADAQHAFRVLYHDNFVTTYVDDIWIYTFHLRNITYPITTIVSLITSQVGLVSTNLRAQELCDWREAIYIDLETDGMSAIGSVIQERPVDIYARWDGSLAFWYDPTRNTVTQAIKPRKHTWADTLPKKAASDAIVYYSNVSVILNNDYRDNFGFATKVYRMPNLEAGAVRAAYLLLKNLFRERRTHDIEVRPDARLELGDKLSVSYTATGTGTAASFVIIVDSMSLAIQSRNSVHQITGREF